MYCQTSYQELFQAEKYLHRKKFCSECSMNWEKVQSLGAHVTNSARNANEVVSTSAAL
jgi:hypothetical protein